MNIYGIIILATLIIEYLLDTAAELANLKSLQSPLPEEFNNIFDEEKYARSKDYTRLHTKFGFVESAISIIITLAFWFAGGFAYIDSIACGVSQSLIVRGLIFTAILIALRAIVSLPFSIYSIFVIEQRFGFNRTTVKTFLLDLLKSIGLGLIIGMPVLAGLLYVLDSAGNMAWLYGWAGVTIVSLIMQYLAPTLIMPLFNKYTPIAEGELKLAIFDYAKKVAFPLKKVFIMDGSKRSTKSNAFFTGFGKNKRIVLYDTLVEKHGIAELVAVLAHEIGHYKKKHILIGTLIGIVHSGIMFYLLSIFLSYKGLYEAFYMSSQPIYAGLLFFGMLFTPIEAVLAIFFNMLSRRHERQADRFATETTQSGWALIEALKKLSADNFSNLTPHRFYVWLNYSHPPVLERIKLIRTIT